MYHVDWSTGRPIVKTEDGEGANLLRDLARTYEALHPDGSRVLRSILIGAAMHMEERQEGPIEGERDVLVYGQLVATLFAIPEGPLTQAISKVFQDIANGVMALAEAREEAQQGGAK